MKRTFLFCGALWMIVRFSFLHFALFSELGNTGGFLTGIILFSFGTMHAVMSAGYIMSGIYLHKYRPVINLLALGQVFALLGDTAFLLILTGAIAGMFPLDYSTLPVFPFGFSPMAVALGMIGADGILLVGLLTGRHVPAEAEGTKNNIRESDELPEVNEVSLEEE